MTPRICRIPAVPSGQGPRADLVEARGSDPQRILRRQRTLSVCPSPAFPIPLESFPLESVPLESFPWKVFPWKVFLWKVFPWKVFPWKVFDFYLAGQTGAPGPPKLRNKERS